MLFLTVFHFRFMHFTTFCYFLLSFKILVIVNIIRLSSHHIRSCIFFLTERRIGTSFFPSISFSYFLSLLPISFCICAQYLLQMYYYDINNQNYQHSYQYCYSFCALRIGASDKTLIFTEIEQRIIRAWSIFTPHRKYLKINNTLT